jgi:competence protein ComEA
MKRDVWLVLLGVFGGLLGGGVIFLLTRPPMGEAIQLLPAPTPMPRVVYVIGEVVNPGLYSLPPGSRLADAIEAAGGFTELAATQAVNLAALVTDGMQIYVPAQTEIANDNGMSREGGISSVGYLVNINTADQAELESLPEIGPVTAQHIIDYRDINGPFQSIEAIMDVPGIGVMTFEAIKDLITVEETP